MSKYYILTGIGREKFHNTSDYIEWVNELSRTDIDFTVTDLGVAADIRGFLEMIRPSFKLSPEPEIPHRFGVVSVDGSYVPLLVEITVVNNLDVSDRWSTEGFIEISDPNGSNRAEFYWIPDSGRLHPKQISGSGPGGPSPVFLDDLASIGGLKSYIYMARRYKRSEVFNQIMTEIYKMSIPSADWNELVEKYRDPDTGISEVPYWDFSIADWLLDDIIEKHLRKHHVSKGESELLRFQILLGPSPVSLRAETPPKKDKTGGE